MTKTKKNYANLMVLGGKNAIKVNHNYVIENHDLIKPTLGNRGGLDNKRVMFFITLIKMGKFDFDLSTIYIDKNFNIVDGHHRVEAFKKLGLPFVVRIVEEKTLSEISVFNSGLKSNWTAEEHFNGAKTSGFKLALFLDEIREVAITKHLIKKNKLSASEMFGLLIGNTKSFGGGKFAPTITDYTDDLLPKAKKSQYKRLVMDYAKMKHELKNIRDAYKIGKYTIAMHFDPKVDFDFHVFVNSLVFEGITLNTGESNYTAKNIPPKVLAIYKAGLRAKKAA